MRNGKIIPLLTLSINKFQFLFFNNPDLIRAAWTHRHMIDSHYYFRIEEQMQNSKKFISRVNSSIFSLSFSFFSNEITSFTCIRIENGKFNNVSCILLLRTFSLPFMVIRFRKAFCALFTSSENAFYVECLFFLFFLSPSHSSFSSFIIRRLQMTKLNWMTGK